MSAQKNISTNPSPSIDSHSGGCPWPLPPESKKVLAESLANASESAVIWGGRSVGEMKTLIESDSPVARDMYRWFSGVSGWAEITV